MTYDASSLAGLVRRCLEAAPLTPLSAISRVVLIDRHTLTRALLTTEGVTFRQLRADILRKRVESVRTVVPPRSIKEIAFELGYQAANSLSRRNPGINGRRLTPPSAREPGRQGRV